MALTPNSDASREQQLAERQQREQEVLLREVDEAVRQDELGGIAKRYGKLIIAGIVLALAAFGGFLFWQDRRENQLEERSEKLIAAYDQLDSGQMGPAGTALAELAKDDASSAPAISAKLAQAGIALNQNRRDEAVALFTSIADDEGAPQPYRDLANVRLMAAQFDRVDPQQVIDRLKPLATPGNAWFGSAGELVAMAYLKQGKENLAGPLFAQIAKDESVPSSLRSRTRQLAGLLGYDAVVDVDATLAEVGQQGDAEPAQ